MRTHRKGDIHPETGLVFRRYIKRCRNGEWWQTREKFEASKRADRSYYEAHVEDSRRRGRRYEATHREQRRIKNRAYHAANREKERARMRAKDREMLRKAGAKWRDKNSEAVRRHNAEWDRKNPGRRRLRRLAARVPLSSSQQKEVRTLYAFRDALNRVHGRIVYHVDHRTPLSRGGIHVPENLQVTTATYNLAKGRKLLKA